MANACFNQVNMSKSSRSESADAEKCGVGKYLFPFIVLTDRMRLCSLKRHQVPHGPMPHGQFQVERCPRAETMGTGSGMFTGLIEGMGRVVAVQSEAAGVRVVVAPPAEMLGGESDRCRLGDSVAINGCCLTVIEIRHDNWAFQAGTETLSKTNLGRLQAGDAVNLERSLPVHGRLGGHTSFKDMWTVSDMSTLWIATANGLRCGSEFPKSWPG